MINRFSADKLPGRLAMNRGIGLTLLMTVAAIGAPNAQATTYIFSADLSGANESPPNASPGSGSSRITFDDVAHTMRVQASFAGLEGTTTAAHIHVLTPPATNGGVATQVPTFAGFPLGVMSGTYDNLFNMAILSSFNPTFVTNNGGTAASAEAALLAGALAGNAYLNIHSNIYPGGEIRGTLTLVPEPAAWVMMIGGFGMVGATMRRRGRIAVSFG